MSTSRTPFTVRPFLAVTAVLLLAPVRAHAVDGVIEINQACVATGCFEGDTAGFPVVIGAAGSYRLTSNLEVPDADTSAVAVNASPVSLDLNGFAISGPTVCSGEPVTSCAPTGSGIGVSAGNGARIYNGTIRGMGSVGVSSGTDARQWDLVVTGNGGGGFSLSRGGSVRTSTITFNGGRGVGATSGGGFAEVSGSTVRGNQQQGVDLSGGIVVENRIQNNGAEGLRSQTGGGDAGYASNVITGNTGADVAGGNSMGCNVIGSSTVCAP